MRETPIPIQLSGRYNQKQLSWDEYFMSIAYIASLRSKDPVTRVGACIVNPQNRIISTGYNGMPNGCDDSEMPWNKGVGLDNKSFYVVHAELNAILHSKSNLEGCRIYVTLFPCNECSKALVQSGIKEVIYLSDKYKDYDMTKASKYILDTAGIKYRQLKSDVNVEIDLKVAE